jgi:nitroreductase
MDRSTPVDQAIVSRKSARAFLPEPVPRALVEHILEVASRAPSGTNMQPWRVYVLTGAALDRFTRVLVEAYLGGGEHRNEWEYYPSTFPEPYLSRRRKVGWELYGLLGIEKGDKERMRTQHARNFRYFDAPVGMIFTIDRGLKIGSWLDFGMFLQNVMIGARGHGLHSCPQAAFAPYHKTIRVALNIPESEVVVCGMALGHIEENAPENRLETERVPVGQFVRFFED